MSTIKPRTTRVVIYQGDDLEQLSVLDATVARAEKALSAAEQAKKASQQDARPRLMHEGVPEDPTINAGLDLDVARQDRDAFAAGAEERGVRVILRAVPRKQWRDLVAAHPARDGDTGDAQFGVNMETFPDALLPKSVDRDQSTIEGDTVEFLESLSDYDYYDRLFLSAYALNRGSAVADPTSRLA